MRKTVKIANPHHEKNKHKTNPHDMFMEEEDTGDGGDMKKIFIGMVPIMLKSTYCMLTGLDDSELQKMNECQYDQVRLPTCLRIYPFAPIFFIEFLYG